MLGSCLKKVIQEQQTYIGLRNFEWRLNTIQKEKKAVNFRGCKFTAFFVLLYLSFCKECTFRFAEYIMLNIQKKMSNGFYALLSLPATAMGFALSVQISALSWILSTKYGLDIHEIGIVWAAGPIAGIIAQPIVGLVSDKLWFMGGRRRPWILLGGILTGLMLLALPNLGIIQKMVMGTEGAEGLLAIAVAVALTLDLSINVSFNPTRSLVSDCSPMAERSKAYTWMQTEIGRAHV